MTTHSNGQSSQVVNPVIPPEYPLEGLLIQLQMLTTPKPAGVALADRAIAEMAEWRFRDGLED